MKSYDNKETILLKMCPTKSNDNESISKTIYLCNYVLFISQYKNKYSIEIFNAQSWCGT